MDTKKSGSRHRNRPHDGGFSEDNDYKYKPKRPKHDYSRRPKHKNRDWNET